MLAMVKAIFQVKHGVVLPTAGFESINPKIQDKEKIVVPQSQVPWPQGEIRRILVTNFGKNMLIYRDRVSLTSVLTSMQRVWWQQRCCYH